MTLKTRDIDSALTSKGFRSDRSRDHVELRFYFGDNRTRYSTVYSHGKSGKEVNDRRIGLMAKQLKISKEQFLGLVNCSISKEQILDIYKTVEKERSAL